MSELSHAGRGRGVLEVSAQTPTSCVIPERSCDWRVAQMLESKSVEIVRKGFQMARAKYDVIFVRRSILHVTQYVQHLGVHQVPGVKQWQQQCLLHTDVKHLASGVQ